MSLPDDLKPNLHLRSLMNQGHLLLEAPSFCVKEKHENSLRHQERTACRHLLLPIQTPQQGAAQPLWPSPRQLGSSMQAQEALTTCHSHNKPPEVIRCKDKQTERLRGSSVWRGNTSKCDRLNPAAYRATHTHSSLGKIIQVQRTLPRVDYC